ncbi:SLBB domain protein [Rosistilla oblonga]|uniref:SLBB domain protein n=1 Tax=Rosistilla oblonga TaxID=2527990 RepID=A0A518INY1_9BACT|nr:SLBB domain-containing protein [Rosistilla oblonga]QDV10925.1 SLBB domain protein [Rosistilla oblonga]QDV54762.1 SLBB domain protein [Rosistilla oblonga]
MKSLALFLSVWLGLAGLIGCSSTANYQASNLPQQLAAPKTVNAKKIDMTALAGTVQPADRLTPGDAVILTVATGIEQEKPPEWTLRVAEDGSLNVPLVGPVAVAGMRLTDAEKLLAFESVRRGVYVSPNVTLRIEQRRAHHVTVLGAVNKPQTYELPAGGSDLMTAISMAEGFSENANTIAQIRHPPGTGVRLAAMAQTQQVAYPNAPVPPPVPDQFELDLLRLDEVPENHRQLVDGSVVMIYEKPERYINVTGLVRQSDMIEMPKDGDMRLMDAISQAGGLSESLADKVKIIRKRPDDSEVVIEASIRDAMKGGPANLRLAPNDLVSVEETPLTYTLGTIKTFIRFGFSSAVPGI